MQSRTVLMFPANTVLMPKKRKRVINFMMCSAKILDQVKRVFRVVFPTCTEMPNSGAGCVPRGGGAGVPREEA